jgi:hypothetical protein
MWWKMGVVQNIWFFSIKGSSTSFDRLPVDSPDDLPASGLDL